MSAANDESERAEGGWWWWCTAKAGASLDIQNREQPWNRRPPASESAQSIPGGPLCLLPLIPFSKRFSRTLLNIWNGERKHARLGPRLTPP